MFRKNSKIYQYLLTSSIFILVSCGGGGYGSSSGSLASELVTNSVFKPYTWQTSTPVSVGLTNSAVNAAINYAMTDGLYTQSAIIVKDGKIIGEQYRGISQSEKNNILGALPSLTEAELDSAHGIKTSADLVHSWSMGKSFTSILFGIAQDQGLISIYAPASNFITEWNNIGDQRQYITIKNLLDMRSGLFPGCFDATEADNIGNCDAITLSLSGGGNIAQADDQLTGCINQLFNGTYDQVTNNPPNVYSNCDTMILGEILHRALTQGYSTDYRNIFEFAKVNLFDKLGITAYWWKDNATGGQDNGNYVTYAGLDMTARDFIKIGQLLLNDGIWEGEQILTASYIQLITSTNTYEYKFWKFASNVNFVPQTSKFVGMVGFDGQYVYIDFDNKILIARNSLYSPVFNVLPNVRKIIIPTATTQNLGATNFPVTVPTIITPRATSPLNQTFQMLNYTTSSMVGALYISP